VNNPSDSRYAALFRFFEEISAIPRGSGNEAAVSAHIADFARSRGLDFYTDELHNLIIRKPASPGAEGCAPVMLQGHLDMVCEKAAAVEHDFERDGIELIVENGVVHANGTTLGADNGAAVAIMMAALDDDGLVHPPLECVFTTQEETGLAGANGLDMSKISARTMLNLDSEEEGMATVSCAGGLRFEMRSGYAPKAVSGCGVRAAIRGLLGGHSGMDIDKERGNAIKLAARLALAAMETPGACLASFTGGGRDNAIARDGEAVLVFPDERSASEAQHRLEALADSIRAEYADGEPGLEIVIAPCPAPAQAVPSADAMRFLGVLSLGMHGVLRRDMQRGGFVVASVNLGVADCSGGEMKIIFTPRSSVQSIQDDTQSRLALLAGAFGFESSIHGRYPGWSYAPESRLREVVDEAWLGLTGEHMRFEALHAGLECGIFSEALPGLDAVAIGPTLRGVHTPQEEMPLDSFERCWDLVRDVLARLAKN
jgi:dipeptidase D